MSRQLAGALCALCLATSAVAQTSEEIWKSYVADPDRHPNIPNCSYAGVFRGEKPIPSPGVVANVKELGAKGDGKTDDTAAFAAAIAQATKTPGAVLIPAGHYMLSKQLVLSDGVVLRGEGADKTTLEFTKPLEQILGKHEDNKASAWSWSGGLIWIAPKDTFDAEGKIFRANPNLLQNWEYWRPTKAITDVTLPGKRGDTSVEVADGSSFKPGQLVLLAWENAGDASLLKQIAGHPSMDAYNWASATWILPPQYPSWQWPAEIKAVKGNVVTLAQPLRLDIPKGVKVAIHEIGPSIREAGVENLHIKLNSPREHKHLRGVGWNAIYFNRAYNCWARRVRITNAENPVIFAAAKNCTVDTIKIDGESMNHHSIACRVNSHDNLVDNFEVGGMWRVKHGINIEWLSSGNVYSRGRMEKGTFDSHRALSFDLIRTEITLTNEADGPGGAGQAGPFIGARVAHWNIRVLAAKPSPTNMNAPGDFVFMPFTFPMGAFVGIQGAEVSDKVRDTTPGEKGSIIADTGRIPPIANLYDAQLKLRLGR